MKIFIALVFCFLHAMAANLQDSLESKVLSFDKNTQTLSFHASNLLVGESGWVVANFSDYSGIVAQVEVIACCKDNLATAKIKGFGTLEQRYLPKPTNLPKEGDKLVFRKLNHRAFLITPNLEFYEQIKSKYQDVTFLSPDLLLGYLFSYGDFDPTKVFFRDACNAYGAGLLYIVNENALEILDCQSFKILDSKKMDTSKVDTIHTPFYSRIKEVKTGTLFGFLQSQKARYYFAYYTNLLHPEISYQPLMLKQKQMMEQKQKEEKNKAKDVQ